MILIVGLGNPGPKFQKTRHNLGFRAVEEFARKYNFPDFKVSRKNQAEISEGILNNRKIILAKPQTFMNLSGKAIKLLILNKKTMVQLLSIPRNLWVIHDDIDLPLGRIRISIGRGAAGHKGVGSVIKELKTKKFVRFRIGIQPKPGKPENVENFVLQKPSEAKPSKAGDETKSQRPFNKNEGKIVREIIKKTVETIEIALKEGIEKAQST